MQFSAIDRVTQGETSTGLRQPSSHRGRVAHDPRRIWAERCHAFEAGTGGHHFLMSHLDTAPLLIVAMRSANAVPTRGIVFNSRMPLTMVHMTAARPSNYRVPNYSP
ncbi:unnamed protein product, partial [Iphiclides podalirius]